MKALRNSLTLQIIVALVMGIIAGIMLHDAQYQYPWISEYIVKGTLGTLGEIFIRLLKLLVVPVVFVSLVNGICALEDVTKLGRIGIKTLGLYILTTALAISVALLASILVQPGVGFEPDTSKTFEVKAPPPLSQVIIDMVPSNIVQSFASGDMLPIIIFSILFGLSMTLVGAKAKPVAEFFASLNEIVIRFVILVMNFAPIGVFALIAQTFATTGAAGLENLAKYFFLVLAVLFFQLLVVYPALLVLLGRLNPFIFIAKMRRPLLFAFSTASSTASIPITLKAVEEDLGVNNSIASFTIPTGATMNMDGTSIMQGCATVFIAQAYQIELSLTQYLMVIFTAVLASIGTAGVPSVGLITLAMVLKQVGLPVDGIAMVMGVDRLLDMVRTAVNITGDAAVTCVVANGEDDGIDMKKFETFS
jgi:Na+/H+-dicarboxylate symporter